MISVDIEILRLLLRTSVIHVFDSQLATTEIIVNDYQ